MFKAGPEVSLNGSPTLARNKARAEPEGIKARGLKKSMKRQIFTDFLDFLSLPLHVGMFDCRTARKHGCHGMSQGCLCLSVSL